ncbi:MAG: hypothetical protein Q8R50_09285 [Sediminibacterium sp.]|nr:hypothetical protein [Sediminibacterium sp.]
MKKGVTLSYMVLYCLATVYCQKRTDSTFLLREFLPDGSYHAVFVQPNKNSEYKKDVLVHFDSNVIFQQLKELKDSTGISMKAHSIPTAFKKTWYTLYLYKDKYYLYHPSDPGTSQWVSITDSSIVELDFDPGIVASALMKFKKKQEDVNMTFTNMQEKNVSMTIHQIDSEKGIAVFERHYGPPEIRYTLMVSEDKLHLFPIIINFCKEGRVEEWKFGTPNFKHLLQKYKR